jgi:hypothetical protein
MCCDLGVVVAVMGLPTIGAGLRGRRRGVSE